MQTKSTPEHHAGTADALYAYMSDCQFGERQLNTMCLRLALEYVYKPHPRFWRDFDHAYLTNAITRRVPDWRAAIERRAEGYADELMSDVESNLEDLAFDEALAEMIRTLPVHERPSDRHSAFEWISAQLATMGLKAELEFAMRAGLDCVDGALEVIDCLDAAGSGRVVDRTGTFVARTYREIVMKRSH
jgi:hypothetical protein